MKYDFYKGLGKGLKFVLTGAIAFVALAGLPDVTIWSLLEEYLKPVLSTLSIGGVLAIVNNWVKIKFGSYGKMLGFSE